MRAPRLDPNHVDLAAFEAWLRAQLPGPAFAAVLALVLQVIRVLFEQNTLLRARINGRRPKPPSEKLATIERQLQFSFAVPINDVTAGAAAGAAREAAGEGDQGAKEEPEKKPRAKPRPREKLPPGMERVDSFNDVCADDRHCKLCDRPMKTFHRRPVETLELIPAKIVVHRRYDEVVACDGCDAIVCAPAPPTLLDGGLLGPTLVTESVCAKVLDGTPIERQARNYQRGGAPVAASTLGRAASSLLGLMVPLADRVMEKVKRAERLQFDATSLKVLDRQAPMGVTLDTLWVFIGDARWVAFTPFTTGDSDPVERLLADADAFSFQCDGTSVTNFIEKKLHRVRPGCHSHGRRRLAAASREGDFRALEGLHIYAKLFAIEKEADRAKMSADQRLALRQEKSAPVMDELRDWVLKHAPHAEPKSKLGEALTYLQRQWMRLNVFLLDGAIELTNNRSERELRPVCLGRHTWLFVGDQIHATRWTAAFTLAHSALAQGLDPRAYLHAVAKALIGGHPHTRLDELLPDAMLRAHPELANPLHAAREKGATAGEAKALPDHVAEARAA
ncbi:MAG TPA: IS66 family transposase [Myxococcota bacterium]|nr:IS66 family transposase [Myxococcota bacterium]